MKYVVIALLFSVTTTLSLPGQPGGNATVTDSHSKSTDLEPIVINNVTELIPNVTDITTITPSPEPTTLPPTTVTPTSTVKPPPPSPTPPNSTTPIPAPTTSVPTPTTSKPPNPPKPDPTTSTTAVPTTTKVTTTTPPHSSMRPIDPTTAAPSHHDRKFDGPSFVGGIVLALGLVAIGFVAFKFYKARTESNYHTL